MLVFLIELFTNSRVSVVFVSGSMEVVNITATQCLSKTSEQMKVKSERFDAINGDQKALEVLKRVKPLPELLQPLIDKVCNGMSKIGNIV